MRWRSRANDKYRWHRWFAWHPVKINGIYFWGEIVEKKSRRDLFGNISEFRVIEDL